MISDNTKKIFKLRNAFKYLFSLLLAAVFLYIAFRGVDVSKVFQIVSNASIFWIIIFAISVMFSHFLRAVRWKIIIGSVKKDASLKNLFGSMMVGYGVSCVIPRLGEVTRAVLIGKWENLSRTSMFGTVILERIIDVIFLGFAVLISIIIWSDNIYSNFPWLKSALYITAFLVAIAFFFLFLIIKYKEKFYNILIKIIGRFSEKYAHKAGYIFDMLIKGFLSLKGVKNYLLAILLSILIMVNYAFSSYLGFYTLGMQNHHLTFGMAWVLMSISAIGVVIPTPGGVGSYEALSKATLVLLFGFGESISLAYAILTHIISYILFIFTALLSFFILNKQHENLFKVIETDLEES
ncbi:MAG TPA: lysylphosphatidylglycerol synthase transmembrane domain-containing protein [Ignavibacteriaceae bacterium]|nr:lysylphosphatidylglycerol synthase transmembrane domain-containing protein [Ignavibacteriaceae bacterium]